MADGFYIPKRFILVLLANFGIIIVLALRANLSVSIVAMVNSTASRAKVASIESECRGHTTNTTMHSNGKVI